MLHTIWCSQIIIKKLCEIRGHMHPHCNFDCCYFVQLSYVVTRSKSTNYSLCDVKRVFVRPNWAYWIAFYNIGNITILFKIKKQNYLFREKKSNISSMNLRNNRSVSCLCRQNILFFSFIIFIFFPFYTSLCMHAFYPHIYSLRLM